MSKKRGVTYTSRAVVACALAAVGAPAFAQSAAPAAAPTNGFDSIVALGQNLAAKGVFIDLGYNETVSALVSGGLGQKGVMPAGNAAAFITLDLQTMLGIPSASLHIAFNERSGIGLGYGGLGGTSALLQADQEPLNWNMSQFFWEQGFLNDRIDIVAGRTQPTFDFMFSDVSCAFVSSIICAQPGSFYFMQDSSPFGWSQWGGRINIQATPEIYIRAGLYNEDPSQAGYMSTGFNWNAEHSVGVFAPVEVGYQTSFRSAALPSKYDVGFYVDTAAYAPVGGGAEKRDRTSFWAQAEQTIWRPNRETNQSVTLFAGAVTYSGGGPFWGQYDVGLYDRAPFGAVRPRDTLGFIATKYIENTAYSSPAYRANPNNQYAFELNYALSIIPGLTLTPFVQYVINPDNPFNQVNTSGSTHLANDTVVGFQVIISPTAIFQFPHFIPH